MGSGPNWGQSAIVEGIVVAALSEVFVVAVDVVAERTLREDLEVVAAEIAVDFVVGLLVAELERNSLFNLRLHAPFQKIIVSLD